MHSTLGAKENYLAPRLMIYKFCVLQVTMEGSEDRFTSLCEFCRIFTRYRNAIRG